MRPPIGPEAEITAVVTVCVMTDAADARNRADEMMGRYRRYPCYMSMVEREGVDELMDLVAIGSPDEVRAELDRYRSASADELAVPSFGNGVEAEAGWAMVEDGLA